MVWTRKVGAGRRWWRPLVAGLVGLALLAPVGAAPASAGANPPWPGATCVNGYWRPPRDGKVYPAIAIPCRGGTTIPLTPGLGLLTPPPPNAAPTVVVDCFDPDLVQLELCGSQPRRLYDD